MMTTRMVRLADSAGQFWDSRLRWGLTLDEEKPPPERIPADSLTARWLRDGGIVYCDPPAAIEPEKPADVTSVPGQTVPDIEPPETVQPTNATSVPDPSPELAERAKAIEASMSLAEVRQACRKRAIKAPAKATLTDLAIKLAVAEWAEAKTAAEASR